ncbi:hypothetical protein OIO90_005739 [Microbotryomycetes sp. JL221]|nr:hypothetical protein OIO90_005739 [Microbotryomycetes sp. JL221]
MKLLVVGGNGFVGSSVVKHAVQRGWDVVSFSASGRPFATNEGFSPSWTRKVEWRQGSPFESAAIAEVLPTCSAAVSTLGVLFETEYKSGGQPSVLGLVRSIARNLIGDRGNPLVRSATQSKTYERMNKDAVLALLDNVVAIHPQPDGAARFPFVYVSAEDIFRPWVSSRYIETKRAAEKAILARAEALDRAPEGAWRLRPILVRPSLVYHPHQRPTTTVPAALLEATAQVHKTMAGRRTSDQSFSLVDKTANELDSLSSSVRRLLSIPPVHVDAVGEAICRSIADSNVEGVVDVARMRGMLFRNEA